jgi:D-glycero-D-manno-heptose 1,7-bisphosphate phosphatase
MVHDDPALLGRDLQLILLDRDGVVNYDSSSYVKTAAEWEPIPGALAGIARLQEHFRVAVCTNQSGIGRGLIDDASLAAIHRKLNERLQAAGGEALDVLFCPHEPDAGCNCRKPAPGLLQIAMQTYGTEPARTLYVGDSEKDLMAAASAGCHAALVLTGNGDQTLHSAPGRAARWVFADLAALVRALTTAAT